MGSLLTLRWNHEKQSHWGSDYTRSPKLPENETQSHLPPTSGGTVLWPCHMTVSLLEYNLPLMGQRVKWCISGGDREGILRSEAYLIRSMYPLAIRKMLPPYPAWGTETTETKGPACPEIGQCSLTWLSACTDLNVLIKWTFQKIKSRNSNFRDVGKGRCSLWERRRESCLTEEWQCGTEERTFALRSKERSFTSLFCHLLALVPYKCSFKSLRSNLLRPMSETQRKQSTWYMEVPQWLSAISNKVRRKLDTDKLPNSIM